MRLGWLALWGIFAFAAAACFRPPARLGAAERGAWARSLLPPEELSTPPSTAPPSRCPAEGLDEARAVALALARSPALRTGRAAARAARARVDAPIGTEPELRLGTFRFDRLREGEPRFGLALRTRFRAPGTIDAQRYERALDETIADADRGEIRAQVIAEVTRRYWRARDGQERLALRETEVALERAQVERIEEAVAARATDAIEAARARLALADAVAATAQAEANVASERAALAQLTGTDPGCPLSAAADDPSPDADTTRYADQPPEALITEALGRRPSLRRAWARVAQSDARRFRAEAERWPRLSFAQVGWYATESLDPAAWGLSLGVSLPFFSLGGGGVEVAEAEARLREAQAEQSARRVAAEVRRALTELRAQERRLDALDAALSEEDAQRLEALAEESARIDPDASAPRATRRELLRWRRLRLEATRDLREARIALSEALGLDPGRR